WCGSTASSRACRWPPVTIACVCATRRRACASAPSSRRSRWWRSPPSPSPTAGGDRGGFHAHEAAPGDEDGLVGDGQQVEVVATVAVGPNSPGTVAEVLAQPPHLLRAPHVRAD